MFRVKAREKARVYSSVVSIEGGRGWGAGPVRASQVSGSR